MLTFENLTRPQRRVHEFLQLGLLFREMASEVPSKAIVQVAGSATEALSFFIESELNYRQAERYQTLGLYQERAQLLNTIGEQANNRGLYTIGKVFPALDQLRSDVTELDYKKVQGQLDEYRQDVRTALAETELKTRDVQRLDDALTTCFSALEQNGAVGLVDHVQEAAKQLSDLRQQPDRGTVDNFPLWKLGGLIIILGVGIIALIHCGIFGCSIDTRNAYITALIITALITLGC